MKKMKKRRTKMRITHNHRTQRTKDVWQYTEINDDGFVTLHIDNDDERVFVITEDRERKEIGTEWDKETYTVGERAYIRRNAGGIRMYYICLYLI